jgi:cobalt-zinc-cadmium efflux system protein
MTNYDHVPVNHQSADGSRGLTIALIIIGMVMVAEIIGGILSNSLALLGDAGHMLVDTLALSLSLIALNIAKKPATTTRTYGFHRAEIIAALANGVALVVVAVYIFYQAYQRFLEPPTVRTTIMMVVAVIGLAANLVAMRLLHHARHQNLNIRAAFWHILGDTISSVGVIVGGIIIAITGWGIVDPIIAVVIGIIILSGAVRLVRESTDILLEAVPKHIPMDKVLEVVKNIAGVEDLHDVHIWTITSGIYAMSSHIVVQDRMVSHTTEIVNAINREVREYFNITHTTLQLECGRCENCSGGLVCEIKRQGTEDEH